MLAQLEQQRTALDAERQDIDAVIETVRRRAGLVVPAALPPARAAKKAQRPTANGKRGADPKTLASIRKQYEAGVPIAKIPEARGHSGNWIYQLASDGGWKRPKPGAAASPAAVAAVPKGHALSGSVKCPNPECGGWTDFDPCRKCGQPLKRKW